MKKFLFFALALLSSINIFAQAQSTKYAEMTFESKEINVGTINNNEVKSASFKFTNTGETDLIIKKVVGSFSDKSGITIDYPPSPIAPGKTGYIKVGNIKYNSVGTKFKKCISILYNGRMEVTRIYISGNKEEYSQITPNKTVRNSQSTQKESKPAKYLSVYGVKLTKDITCDEMAAALKKNGAITLSDSIFTAEYENRDAVIALKSIPFDKKLLHQVCILIPVQSSQAATLYNELKNKFKTEYPKVSSKHKFTDPSVERSNDFSTKLKAIINGNGTYQDTFDLQDDSKEFLNGSLGMEIFGSKDDRIYIMVNYITPAGISHTGAELLFLLLRSM